MAGERGEHRAGMAAGRACDPIQRTNRARRPASCCNYLASHTAEQGHAGEQGCAIETSDGLSVVTSSALYNGRTVGAGCWVVDTVRAGSLSKKRCVRKPLVKEERT
jgi:hypothetical protein